MKRLSLISLWLTSLLLISCNNAKNTGPYVSLPTNDVVQNDVVHVEVDTSPIAADIKSATVLPCGPKQIDIYISNYAATVEGPGDSLKPRQWDSIKIFLEAKDFQELSVAPFKITFSLFPSAYACPPSWYITSQKIKSFSITSDSYFAVDLPPNSELKQFFEAELIPFGGTTDLTNYPENSDTIASTYIYLTLKQEPLDNVQNFTIKVEFDDGNISEVQTGEIILSGESELTYEHP